MDYNARDYLNNTFIKKEDLRASGPRRLQIHGVEEADGFPDKGKPAKKELHLLFADQTRFSLRAQVNLNRVREAFGDRTSLWIGKTIELYFSPDVTNPGGGEPGGARVRVPDPGSAPSPGVFVSELEPAAEKTRPKRSASSAAPGNGRVA